MTAWTLVESDYVEQQKDRLCREFSRFDDLWTALTWIIAKNPRNRFARRVRDEDDFYLIYIDSKGSRHIPDRIVMYRVDDENEQVHLLTIY